MSEKTNNGFDEAVRSLLKDAREEVPSRVWDSISSAGVADRRRTGRFVLPVAVVAAAASIALFFMLRPNSPAPALTHPVQLCEEQWVEVPEVDLTPAQELRIQKKSSSEKTYLSKMERPADATGTESETSTSAESAAGTPVASHEVRNSEVSSSGVGKPVAESNDVFAGMKMEKSVARLHTRPQFSFRASMVGSEGSASSLTKGTSGVPGWNQGQSLSETSVSTFGVPLTLGAGVRFEILPRFFIGTGIDYSFLSRTFSADFRDASLTRSGDVRHSMHYIGIPIILAYEFVRAGSLSLYVDGGGRAEWCISNSYAFRDGDFSTTLHSPVKFPQASVTVGIGAQYGFAEHFALYMEPNVRYYFYCSQPKNLRTERPFLFDLNIGVRFSL